MYEEQQQATAIIKHEIISPPFGMDYRDWFKFKKDLETKKSKVRAKVEKVKKNFINTDENYSSTEASDIYEAVRSIMDDEKLGFNPEFLYEEETQTRSMNGMMKAFMQVTWTDLETGYFECQKWLGTGADNGDKGVYKAYTGAIKYALQATFLIPTENNQTLEATTPPPKVVFVDGTAVENAEFEKEMQRQEKEMLDKQAEKEKKALEYAKRQDAVEKVVISDTGEGITSGQIEVIKNALEVLSEQATTPKNKKIAQGATMASLTGKPDLRAYNERVKGEKDIDKMIAALTREEAEIAIIHFNTWVSTKAAAKQKKEQAEAAKGAKAEEVKTEVKEPKQQEANW